MKLRTIMILGLSWLIVSLWGSEQNSIKPVLGFMEDARINRSLYGEAFISFNDYGPINSDLFWVQGGYPINEKLEIGTALGFIYYVFESDLIDDELGLSDIRVSAKYNFMQDMTKLTGGSYLTLPVGSEDVGQQNLNFGFWGSVHYPLNQQFDLASSIGLDFYETYNMEGEEEYDSSFSIKLGALSYLNPQLTLIPEFNFRSEGDYGLLSVGVDYLITEQGHLRGALGIGLDDGAPDLALQIGFLKEF